MKLFVGYLAIINCFVLISAIKSSFLSEDGYQSDYPRSVLRNPYFLVSTPKVWISTVESVCVVLLQTTALPNADIRLSIESFNSQQVFVQRNEPLNSISQCIQVPIANIRADRALLKVQLADLMNETLVIKVKPSQGITLIETSKPIYRPNELLQFRVITLNDWLRPIGEQYEQIVVENSNSIPVMLWNDINTTQGMIMLEMPIAENNVMGLWKIKATSKKNIVTEKSFKIMDYERPEIQINVETPNYILANNDRSIACKVCVTNNYGEAMTGQLNAIVSYFKLNWNRPDVLGKINSPFVTIEENIDDCYNLALDSSQLEWNSTKYSQNNLKLNLQFIEQNTGFKEEKFVEIPIVQTPLNIIFPSVKLMKQYYKPGLPYFGYIVVSHPDYSYAIDEPINVCYEMRQTPWVSDSVAVCEQISSDSDGLIHFTIPPTATSNNTNDIRQIIVSAQSIRFSTVQNLLVLDPTYSKSDAYMSIKPTISRNHCSDSVEFDLLFNRPLENNEYQNMYYQVYGSGLISPPKSISITPSHRWTALKDKHMIGSQLCHQCDIPMAKIRIDLPKSPLNNNIINRILLFYLDSNGNLIADSNVFLTTCLDHRQHLTRIALNPDNRQDGVDLSLGSELKSKCAVRVSQNKPYSSVAKLNQFIEKFNTQRQELSVRDNCQMLYEMKKRNTGAPYMSPYGDQEKSAAYQPVLDYGDAWDSFNDIGLLVTSNAKLDECPCDFDLYPSEVLAKLRARQSKQMKYLNRNSRQYVRNQLQDLEKSLLNEILYWDVLDVQNQTISSHISHPLISTTDQLHSDALCLSDQNGITYTRHHYVPKLDPNGIKLIVNGPQTAKIGDTLMYKVYIRKTSPTCLPIQIQLDESSQYDIVNVSPVMCICYNQSFPGVVKLRPKQTGLTDIVFRAINPLIRDYDNVTIDCNVGSEFPQFSPLYITKRLDVRSEGVYSENIKHHLICNDNNEELTHESRNQNLHQLPEYKSHSSQAFISNDIVSPMMTYIRWKASTGDQNSNALDSLSTFATSYYLYDYLQNSDHESQEFNEIQRELSTSYQTLMAHRHLDGSYSLSRPAKKYSDVALSTAIFKVLAQSKKQLNYIDGRELRRTLLWIYSQQSDDGCFYGHPRNKFNAWPLNFDNQYDLTGYVISSLLDAGLDFDSEPIRNAYKCLENNIFATDIKQNPLPPIFYAYIQALAGNTDQAMHTLSKLKRIEESIIDNEAVYSSELLSYLALTFHLTNEQHNAIVFGKLLMKRQKLWRTPINCYAAIKLWPLMKIKRTTLQVYRKNDELVSTLQLNETHTRHSFVGDKIAMHDSGCLLTTNRILAKQAPTKSAYFDVSLDNLDRGYTSCRRRMINMCIKEMDHYSSVYPVVKFQLISGFQVDKKLMKRMIDSEVVSKYKEANGELVLFLHKIHASDKSSECIAIPLLESEQHTSSTSRGTIRVYDYYNEDASDVLHYTLPRECHIEIEDKSSHRKIVRQQRKKINENDDSYP